MTNTTSRGTATSTQTYGGSPRVLGARVGAWYQPGVLPIVDEVRGGGAHCGGGAARGGGAATHSGAEMVLPSG
jgi:hypothetical protein